MTDAEYALSEIANLATTVIEDTEQDEVARRACSSIRDTAIDALLTLTTELAIGPRERPASGQREVAA